MRYTAFVFALAALSASALANDPISGLTKAIDPSKADVKVLDKELPPLARDGLPGLNDVLKSDNYDIDVANHKVPLARGLAQPEALLQAVGSVPKLAKIGARSHENMVTLQRRLVAGEVGGLDNLKVAGGKVPVASELPTENLPEGPLKVSKRLVNGGSDDAASQGGLNGIPLSSLPLPLKKRLAGPLADAVGAVSGSPASQETGGLPLPL